MTQAAYAIDDMQYGFQGVQNNLQAIAVSMGASRSSCYWTYLTNCRYWYVDKEISEGSKGS